MNVLHVITTLSRGGAEGMLYRLLESTRESSVRPMVVSMVAGGYYFDQLRKIGIPTETLGMRAGLPNPITLLRLREMVRRFNPVVVHSWMYHAALVTLLTAPKRSNIIAIRHALHDIEGEKFLTRAVIRGLASLSTRAERIVYCSATSRSQHEAIGFDHSRGTVVPNGFDCERFKPIPAVREAVRAELDLPEDAFVIGHVGRYHETKDHAGLIRAFGIVARTHENSYLVLAGHGVVQENEKLAAVLAEQQNVRLRVRLLGERDDVPRLMNSFDVLASSSRSEAFPNSLGEAMASGVPCVATDVGDSAYIIGETGLLVPPRNPEALAESMKTLLTLPADRRVALGAQARRRVIERFSLRRAVSDYAALYENVAANAGSRAQ